MLDELKLHLQVDSGDSDYQLSSLLMAGEQYYKRICGLELDYENNAEYKLMLFEYCRYAYANALELFEINFKSQLLALQLDVAVNSDERQ